MDSFPLSAGEIIVAGISIPGFINGLLDYIKSFAPNASGNVWRAGSFVLGVLGFLLSAFLKNHGLPTDPEGLVLLVFLGLAAGLAAGVAYDNREKRALRNIVKRSVARLKQREASKTPVEPASGEELALAAETGVVLLPTVGTDDQFSVSHLAAAQEQRIADRGSALRLPTDETEV